MAVLMVVLLLPVQAFAATEEIKGAYVGQKFEHVIGNVVGAKTFSKSGDIPEGLKGLPSTLIAAALTSVSFLGFSGVIDGIFG